MLVKQYILQQQRPHMTFLRQTYSSEYPMRIPLRMSILVCLLAFQVERYNTHSVQLYEFQTAFLPVPKALFRSRPFLTYSTPLQQSNMLT